MKKTVSILLEVLLGICLTVLVTQLILPQFFKTQVEYFNLNEVYLAFYLGLLVSAFQIALLFIWVLIFVKPGPPKSEVQCS